MDLKGKVALITGGGTGLGRTIALLLAGEGVNVAVNYSRSKEDAEKTVKDIQSMGVKAIAVKGDVSIPHDAEHIVAETEKALGRFDILVNNAGTTKFVPFKDLDGLDEDDWLRLFKTNALSIFFTGRAAAKLMKKQGGGHIINTVSIAGLTASGSSIAYAVSKAAGTHITKCLAVALAPDVQVNGVAPGLLLTRWSAGFSPEQLEKIKDSALLHRATDLEDTASLYVSLLKNDSITGQVITVDCGQSVPR